MEELVRRRRGSNSSTTGLVSDNNSVEDNEGPEDVMDTGRVLERIKKEKNVGKNFFCRGRQVSLIK